MKKQRLSKIGDEGGHDYMMYINNDQLLVWARNDRIRAYINGGTDTRDDNLRKDMRYFISEINKWPIMQEYNLGLFQADEDQLYADFMEMINEELELGSLGIVELSWQVRNRSIQAVHGILDDLTDRRGLRQEWEQIDDEIQDEIREEWVEIVSRAYV